MTDYTPNFRFQLPQFNAEGWDTAINSDLLTIDAILAKYVTLANLQGLWINSTAYTVGQTVVDSTDASLWTISVNATSAASPTTFAADRAANPTWWINATNQQRARGVWVTATHYSIGDFVVSGHIYAVCISAHTSSALFATDSSLWVYLVDLTADLATATTAATTAVASATAASTSATAAAVSVAVVAGSTGIRNYINNGAMGVWQRGTSVVLGSANGYTADQMLCLTDQTGGTLTVTQGTLAASDPPHNANHTYFLNYGLTGMPSGGTYCQLLFPIENPLTLAGKTCRLTFWGSADSNVAISTIIQVIAGTGGMPAGSSATFGNNFTLTSTWQQFSTVITLPTGSTITPGTNKDGRVNVTLGFPLSVALNMQFTGVQLTEDLGGVTPFEHRTAGNELAVCQRYFQIAEFYGTYSAQGASIQVTTASPVVTMRAIPTVTITSNTDTNISTPTITASLASFVAVGNITATGAARIQRTITASAEL